MVSTGEKTVSSTAFRFVERLRSADAFYYYMGRVALHALLKAMGIGRNDRVIQQVFTCSSVAMPVFRVGATPKYVDIDPITLSLSPTELKAKLTDKTKAIIVQHTYGIPAEIDRIMDIAKKHGLYVIEDCCHALGSKYEGQEVGTFGDAAFYSFGWNKPVAIGMGGAAVVNNPDIRRKLQQSRHEYEPPSCKERAALLLERFIYQLLVKYRCFNSARALYRSPRVRLLLSRIHGYNADDVFGVNRTAADDGGCIYSKTVPQNYGRMLHSKLNDFGQIAKHQEWVVSRYRDCLRARPSAHLTMDGRFKPTYFKYPYLSLSKATVYANAGKMGIELSEMFRSPVCASDRDAWESLGYRKGMCPVSERISESVIPLATHCAIREKEIAKTAALIGMFEQLPEVRGENE